MIRITYGASCFTRRQAYGSSSSHMWLLTWIQMERHLKALPRGAQSSVLCTHHAVPFAELAALRSVRSFISILSLPHRDSVFIMQLHGPKYAGINSHTVHLLPAVDKPSTSWNAAIFHSGMERACVCTSRVLSPQTLLHVRSAATAVPFLHSAKLQKLHSCCSKCLCPQHLSLPLSASCNEPSFLGPRHPMAPHT